MSTEYIPFRKKNASGQPSGETRAALLIAHPGHELCLMGWLKKARPCVFILTDGSGSGDQPRLDPTTELLSRLSVPAGEIYGRLSDAEVYRAIISGNAGIFCDLAGELAEIFTCQRFDYVVCEAVEGYNPTHDLCWFIIEAALARANRMSDHQTLGYEVNLIRRTSLHEEAPQENSIWLRLDDHALVEKTKTMRANPHLRDEVSAGLDRMDVAALLKYPELTAELQGLVNEMGPEAFRVEHLQPMKAARITGVPFYERYGETLVRSGRYEQAIRFGEHMAPIVESLRRFGVGNQRVVTVAGC
jgi:hypothetical protein